MIVTNDILKDGEKKASVEDIKVFYKFHPFEKLGLLFEHVFDNLDFESNDHCPEFLSYERSKQQELLDFYEEIAEATKRRNQKKETTNSYEKNFPSLIREAPQPATPTVGYLPLF